MSVVFFKSLPCYKLNVIKSKYETNSIRQPPQKQAVIWDQTSGCPNPNSRLFECSFRKA